MSKFNYTVAQNTLILAPSGYPLTMISGLRNNKKSVEVIVSLVAVMFCFLDSQQLKKLWQNKMPFI